MAINNIVNIRLDLIDKASKKLEKIKWNFANLNDKIKANAGKLAAVWAVWTAAFWGIIVGGNKLIDMNTDLKESINAVNVNFWKGADKILEFGKNSADAVGLSTASFNQLSAGFWWVIWDLTKLWLSEEEIADITISLTERASDLASVNNTTVAESFNAIWQAVRGETEAIRKYWSDVTDASLAEFAHSEGIKKKVSEMTQQEKKQLRIKKILSDTKKVQDDFADNSDSLAVRQLKLTARMEDFWASVWKIITPVKELVFDYLEPLLEWTLDFVEEHPKLTAALIAIGVWMAAFAVVVWIVAVAVGALSVVSLPLVVTILLVWAAILAVVAIGVLLYKNWDVIKEKAWQLWEFIWKAWDWLWEKTKAIWEGFKTFISDSWDSIVDWTMEKLWKLLTWVIASWIWLKEKISEKMTAIKESISEGWDNIKTKTMDWINGMWESITTGWDNIKTKTMDWINGLWNIITTGWNNIKTKTMEWLTGLWNSITTAWDNIKTSVWEKLEALKTKISDVWDNVKTRTSEAWDSIKTSVINVIDDMKARLSNILQKAKDVAREVATFWLAKTKTFNSNEVDWNRAVWGTVQAWKTYRVWENGEEFFSPSTSWKIIPNNQLWQWGNTKININFWGVSVRNDNDISKMVAMVEERLTRALQLQRRGIS